MGRYHRDGWFLDALHVLPQLNNANLLTLCVPMLSSSPAPCKVCWGAAFQLIKKGPPRSPEGWVTDSGWEDSLVPEQRLGLVTT